MRIAKIILLIAVTVGLLLVCAGLPSLTAAIQDRSLGQTRQSPLDPIHLELNPDNETPEVEPAMGILEKLALLQSAYMFPLDSGSMIMSEAQVQEEASAALAPYIGMGVIPDLDYRFYMEPVIAMSSEALGSYLTFWNVILVHEENPYVNILLHLDDQTGKVLLLQYEGYEWTFEKEIHGALLEEIAALFFDGLELPEALEALKDPKTNVSLVDLTEKCTAISCTIDTAEYGPLLIEIYMSENTFNTAYPTSPD